MTALLSPLALALTLRPDGVEIHDASNREDWLALRGRDVTASAAGAVLGIHEYLTPLALWAEKACRTADAVEIDPAVSDDGCTLTLPPAGRGLAFENVSVDLVRKLRPDWSIDYPIGRYWTSPGDRIGATPDAFAIRPDRPGFGVIQIKTTAEPIFREKWLDPDTREVVPPDWIAVQAIVEAKMTGASWATVGVARFGFATAVTLVDIPLHDRLWARVVAEVKSFWELVASGQTPPMDYGRDGALIARLYADADPAASVDLTSDNRVIEIVAQRAALKEAETTGASAAKARKEIDNELIAKLGNAATGILPGGALITAKTTRRAAYEVKPTAFRTVKITGGAIT